MHTLRTPQNYSDSGLTLMLNYDHYIDQVVADRLMNNNEYATYPGWNFYARVWFVKSEKVWCAEVFQYGVYIDTLVSQSPDELMTNVSNEFGWD